MPSAVTAGTKDQAGNNLVNLLRKLNSQDTAQDFKKLGIDADIYHTNVGDAKSQANNYDVVFCSDSLVGNFGGSKATVIGLKNLLSEAEMTEKIQAAGLK